MTRSSVLIVMIITLLLDVMGARSHSGEVIMFDIDITQLYKSEPLQPRNYLFSNIQSNFFITSLVITEYSISDINLLGTDLFSFKITSL